MMKVIDDSPDGGGCSGYTADRNSLPSCGFVGSCIVFLITFIPTGVKSEVRESRH